MVRGYDNESARMASTGFTGLWVMILEIVPGSFVYSLAGPWGKGVGEKIG